MVTRSRCSRMPLSLPRLRKHQSVRNAPVRPARGEIRIVDAASRPVHDHMCGRLPLEAVPAHDVRAARRGLRGGLPDGGQAVPPEEPSQSRGPALPGIHEERHAFWVDVQEVGHAIRETALRPAETSDVPTIGTLHCAASYRAILADACGSPTHRSTSRFKALSHDQQSTRGWLPSAQMAHVAWPGRRLHRTHRRRCAAAFVIV